MKAIFNSLFEDWREVQFRASEFKNMYIISGVECFNRMIYKLFEKNIPWWRLFSTINLENSSRSNIQDAIRVGFLQAYPEAFKYSRHYDMSQWLADDFFKLNKVRGMGNRKIIHEDEFIISLFEALIDVYGDRPIKFTFGSGNGEV